MKYKKFELIRSGKNPLIRVTYLTFWGKEKVKDIVKSEGCKDFWVFCENNDLTFKFGPINAFYKSEERIYIVNDQP